MMNEKIHAILEPIVENGSGIGVWQTILLIFVSGAAAFLGAYLKEKAKSTATKEDIEDITQRIENVKINLGRNKEIESIKYNLRYDACLESLRLIDALLSHLLAPKNSGNIIQQYASTEEARQCHSKLILSCENTKIITMFNEILFGPVSSDQESRPPTDLLNEYRNLIRIELGFGTELPLDRQRAWIGMLNCENKNC